MHRRPRGACRESLALVKRVPEVLHESDLRAPRDAEPKAVAKRKGEIAIAIHWFKLLTSVLRAKVAKLDNARGHLDYLVESQSATGVKNRLQRENITVSVDRRCTPRSHLERDARERTQQTDRRPTTDSVLQRSAPPQSVGEEPVAARAAVGE